MIHGLLMRVRVPTRTARTVALISPGRNGRGLFPGMSESSSGKRRPARRATSQRRRPPQANRSPTDELAALRDRVGTLERELAAARARAAEAAEQQAAMGEVLQVN